MSQPLELLYGKAAKPAACPRCGCYPCLCLVLQQIMLKMPLGETAKLKQELKCWGGCGE